MPSAVERKELQQFPVVREVCFYQGFIHGFSLGGGKYANACNKQMDVLVHPLTIFDICKDKKHQFQLSYIKPIIMLYFNCYCVVPHCSC